MRTAYRKYEKVLTPSGLWDNGFYKLTIHLVRFPPEKFDLAIKEDVSLKIGHDSFIIATRITIDGNHWTVEKI